MTSVLSISLQGAFFALQSLLADDTERSPRDCVKALRIDFLFAANAESKCACSDAAKCGSHFSKLGGIAREICRSPLSRSPACWIRSSSSGLVSMAKASRLMLPFRKPVCRLSKMLLNAFSSIFVCVFGTAALRPQSPLPPKMLTVTIHGHLTLYCHAREPSQSTVQLLKG
jgi:hypothetical protein